MIHSGGDILLITICSPVPSSSTSVICWLAGVTMFSGQHFIALLPLLNYCFRLVSYAFKHYRIEP
jgi:hypothetical protein